MKNDAVSVLLVGLLLVTAVSAAVLAYTYSNYKQQVIALDLETRQFNQDIARMQALAGEVSEYSKKNPAIIPILRELQEGGRAGTSQSAGAR